MHRWAQLWTILFATCDPAADPSWKAVPEFQDVYYRILDIGGLPGKTKWTAVTDDAKFAAYQTLVTAFASAWDAARLVQWKKQRVGDAHQAMAAAYGATWTAGADAKREYDRLDALATEQLDTVTAVGRTDWDTLIDDVMTFTRRVRGKWFV